MITSDLIEYIKSQLNKNISKDLIISQLLEVGWYLEDINEGFLNIESELSSVKKINEIKEEKNIEVEEKFDPYRELPVKADPSLDITNEYISPVINTIDKIQPMKIWSPITIKPKVVEIKEEEPIVFSKITDVEIFNPELTQSEKPKSSVLTLDNLKSEIKKQEEIEYLTPAGMGNFNTTPKVQEASFISPVIEIPKIEIKNDIKQDADVFMPTINKASFQASNSQGSLPPRKIQDIKTATPVNSMMDIVPRSAMITSYSQDILSAKQEDVTPPPTKRNLFIKWGIAIFVLSLIGGMVFAFVEGSFSIPLLNVNLSVVKRDPKVTIINAPLNISKLDSYKVDTEISISSPSLSSITTGLSSGEAIVSKDKDSISIKTKGLVNHIKGKLNFDYTVNLNSSILKNDIDTNIKYDGSDLYVVVPDLTQVLGKNSPPKTVVSLEPKQVGLITEEFSPFVKDIIKKIDIYNILSSEVPLFVKNSLFNIFTEFINTLEYTEKGIENIDGIDMYHYELNASRESTKKLLVSFVDIFTKSTKGEQNKNLEEALGASSINSFEVWVGKDDDNLYQIKFTLKTPLSRVLGLNDSGIAGNEVNLDWVTKFYDLNIPNDIKMPKEDVNMDGFINKIRDIKIKNILSSFKSQAKSLHNSIGSYGLRSNPTGNCINPNPGSLFSPTGHTKGADGAISSISNSMTSILVTTNGLGSCYSTSQAWALSVPLFSESSSLNPNFYCTDSTGNIGTITSPIKGALCK